MCTVPYRDLVKLVDNHLDPAPWKSATKASDCLDIFFGEGRGVTKEIYYSARTGVEVRVNVDEEGRVTDIEFI